MEYKKFLLKLGIKSNVDISGCINLENIESKELFFFNNLIFAPMPKDIKEKIYLSIKDKILDKKTINELQKYVIKIYCELFKKYPIKKVLIEKITKNIVEWTDIICDKRKIPKILLEQIETDNLYFWYMLAKDFYKNDSFNEAYLIIKNKLKLFKGGYLWEDINFLYIKVLKELDYLNDSKILKEFCKTKKHISSFKYLKILMEIECSVLRKNGNVYKKILKYKKEIENFEIIELLNIYELAIISEEKSAIDLVYKILIEYDIGFYIGEEEFEIYKMLNYLYNNDFKNFNIFRKKLKDNYDFKHIDWYLNNKRR